MSSRGPGLDLGVLGGLRALRPGLGDQGLAVVGAQLGDRHRGRSWGRGGSRRGRTTTARRTVQTMTARNSGSKPLRSYLEVALPLGRCSGLSSERGRSGGTAQEREEATPYQMGGDFV